MATWKKWILLGVSAGASFALLSALIYGGVVWYSSRPTPWKSDALSVVWSEAHETYNHNEKARTFEHASFLLYYALQNNTARDITISNDAVVMKRLVKGNMLVDFSRTAKPDGVYFIPAKQRAEFSIKLDDDCSIFDVETGVKRIRDPKICFSDALSNSDGFVLFDHKQRLQVYLPKPALK